MADFDPHTYMAQVKAAPGPQFDPSQYLAQVGAPKQIPDSADQAAQGNKPDAKSISLPQPSGTSPTSPLPGPHDLSSSTEQAQRQGQVEAQRSNDYQNATKAYYDNESQQPALTRLKHSLFGDSNNPLQPVESVGAAGLTLPAEAAPAGLMKLVNYLGGRGIAPALARTGVNTAMGGAQGALQNPDNPWEGAKAGAKVAALLSGGLETAGQIARPISAGLQRGGRAVGGLGPEETAAYQANPTAATDAYKMEKNDPLAFQEASKGAAQTARDRLQSQYIDPRRTEIRTSGLGKSYAVNPAQFEGTAAYPEMQSAWDKQGNTVTAEGPLTEGGRTSSEAPAPMPKTISLNTDSLLRAKGAAGKASNIPFNPQQMPSPADTELAQKNSNAAVSLGKALEALNPKAESLNDEISSAIVKKQELERLRNPSRLYQTGDTPGSVPIRSLQQYLDENTGSTFQDDARAIHAARALHDPMSSLSIKGGSLPARLLLGSARGGKAATGILQAIDPALTQDYIKRGLFDNQE